MFSLAVIPARSVALIMEESPEDFLLAGSRASAVAFMAAGVEAFTVVEVTRAEVTGNSVLPWEATYDKATYDMENEIMRITNLISKTSSRPRSNRIAALTFSALLIVGCSQLSFAQKSGPATFSSPGEATEALFQAVQNGDEEALQRILGAGKEVTSSGDEIEDKLEHERFSQKYQEMHRLVREPDGSTVLYIGAENWPFPIPLVSKTSKTNSGAWYFDSDSGTQEILFRTVGENETTAIQVCRALAKAKERSETSVTGDDPIGQYAQSLISARTANAENTSRSAEKESSPFHGYYFRVVTGNSAATANSYAAGVKKTPGLALVAYPAEYGSSGVMTFIVTQDGVVYEKDLGQKTSKVAPVLKKRSPDSSWHVADGAPSA
jgi:hypothetical protein